MKFLNIRKISQNLPTGKRVFFHAVGQTDRQTDLKKLAVVFIATLRMHLRYWMVISSGVLVENSFFFSVIFDSLSKYLFSVQDEVIKPTPVSYPCSRWHTKSVCGPTFKNRQRFSTSLLFVVGINTARALLVKHWRYSSTLSLASSLDGGGRSAPTPDHFIPGKYTR
jgi:hypothetical protein